MSISGLYRNSGARAFSWIPSVVVLAALQAGASGSACAAIHALSSDPRLVSGGNVLVQVDAPREGASLSIDLNGRDVTGEFQRDPRTGALIGLVGGLTIGQNTVNVFDHGTHADSLALTNYPISGPITSGPHITPFICQTQEFVLPDGSKLGPPLDADCSVPTVVQYLYLATGASALVPLPSTSRLPDDVSKITTLAGLTVPFVVRVETSTINQASIKARSCTIRRPSRLRVLLLRPEPGTSACSPWKASAARVGGTSRVRPRAIFPGRRRCWT